MIFSWFFGFELCELPSQNEKNHLATKLVFGAILFSKLLRIIHKFDFIDPNFRLFTAPAGRLELIYEE